MIQFDNVTAQYTKKAGIFDLSFKISEGEMVFLMGPTGAGKSTVLRTIFRDIPVKKGKIYISGEEITKRNKRETPHIRRKMGMIFQDFKLLNDRTIYENIALPLRISRVPMRTIRKKVLEALEDFNLVDRKNAFPLQLSGGEQQSVSIARALIREPKIILADEPTGNLDLNISKTIIDILEQTANNGATVIMATHNFPLIRSRKKRFIELNEGSQVQ